MVDHGEMTVGYEGLQRRSGVADRVGEEVLLRFQPWCLTRDDLLSQGNHSLPNRYGEQQLLTQVLVQLAVLRSCSQQKSLAPCIEARAAVDGVRFWPTSDWVSTTSGS